MSELLTEPPLEAPTAEAIMSKLLEVEEQIGKWREENRQRRDEGLYTLEEAAHYLKIAPGTLNNWLSMGRIDLPIIRLGSRRLFRKDDLDRVIDQHREGAMPTPAKKRR